MFSGKKLFQINKITKRFSHFFSINCNHIVVHPVVNRHTIITCIALGYFSFMMWKHKIHTSSMYVKCFTKIFLSHSRTFHMPSRKTFSPRRRPSHNMLLRCFLPYCKIYRILFFRLFVKLSSALYSILKVSSRQYSIWIFFIVLTYI